MKPGIRAGLALLAYARVAGVAVLAMGLAACGGGSHQTPQAPEVSVMTVAPKTIPVTWKYTGQTQGYRLVEVRARVSGILLKRSYTEGSFVKKGRALFEINPTRYRVAVTQQQAVVAQMQATLDKTKRNLARVKPLHASGAVSGKDYDDAISAEQVAKANLDAARAALEAKRIDLGYTHVTAPISGISGKANQAVGSLVTTGEGSLLTTIAQTDPMYVYFSIADNDYLKLKQALAAGTIVFPKNDEFQVALLLGDGGRFKQTGKLDFMNNVLDPNTGTILLRASFPNPNGQLVPNQFVRVILNGAVRPHAILVPQRAVMQNAKGQFVYVVNAQGKADVQAVETGPWIGTDWLITKGLAAGDRVITAGMLKLRPGVAVTITPARVAGTSAAAAASP